MRSGRLLLVQLDGYGVKRPTAHQVRNRQPSLRLVFRINDSPSAVNTGFASPSKIPQIALRVQLFASP
jgi:hypothetical protein